MHSHQVWAMDVQFDTTADGRRLNVLNVIDEYSRLCLTIRGAGAAMPKAWCAVLDEHISLHPTSALIRSDNGPEFIAHTLRCCCETGGTTTASIPPGSPWENGFAESFNG